MNRNGIQIKKKKKRNNIMNSQIDYDIENRIKTGLK